MVTDSQSRASRAGDGVLPFAIFVLSGYSALTFEVLWVRLASHSLGVASWAVSVVVSTFMGGLALGGYLLGPYADRHPRPARMYAALEVGIAALGLLASFLLQASAEWGLPTGALIALTMAALLAPCTLMGGTLPALARAVSSMGSNRGVSYLYAANTAGAVLAAFATDWLLVPRIGVNSTIGVCFVASSLAALLAAWTIPDSLAAPPAAPTRPRAAASDSRVFLAYGMAGLVSLGLQVAWTRLILCLARPTIYNVSMVLAIFLTGLFLGSSTLSGWARKVERPARWLGITMAAIALSSLLCLLLLGQTDRLVVSVVSGLAFSPMVKNALTCALTCIGLFGLPTFLMGAAFPLAARLALDDSPEAGQPTGLLCTANTVGGILGALAMAFLLAPGLGLFRAIVVLLVLEALTGLWMSGPKATFSQVATALTCGALLFPSTTLLHSVYYPVWSSSYGILPGSITYFRDDSYATVAVADTARGKFLMVNSTRMMGDAPEGLRYACLMGHLPSLLVPNPKNALVICFGCGMTTGALDDQPEFETITCVELSQAVLDAGHLFARSNGDVKDSTRVKFVLADGRNYLARSRQKYDVITFEPPPPTQAGVVNLYSADYYELCRDRLTDQGIVCQWVPLLLLDEPDLRLVVKAFLQVFPNATLWEGSADDYLLIGSKAPLQITYQDLEARMADPELRARLARIGVEGPADLLATYMHGPEYLRRMTASTPVTTDDRPYLEYSTSVRPTWDESWRRRDLGELWPVLAADSKAAERIASLAGAWQSYREAQIWPATSEPAAAIERLCALRTALLTIGPNAYIAATASPQTRLALSPDPRQTEGIDEVWALWVDGQAQAALKALAAMQLSEAQRERIEASLRKLPARQQSPESDAPKV
jgi:predicted membrane-bound spermidine synthase